MTGYLISVALIALAGTAYAISAWRHQAPRTRRLANPQPLPGEAAWDATRERLYCRCIGCSDQREAHERELRGQP